MRDPRMPHPGPCRRFRETRWRAQCAPNRCAVVTTVIAGLAIGIGVAGVLWLLWMAGLIGVAGGIVAATLAIASIVLAAAMVAAARWRCFTSTG
jgi:hypothetical protein